MNIPDLISESLGTIFWVNKVKFFDADPNSGSGIFLTLDPGWKKKFGFGIRDNHPGSATPHSTPSFVFVEKYKVYMLHKKRTSFLACF
jgi:hypothetical protein